MPSLQWFRASKNTVVQTKSSSKNRFKHSTLGCCFWKTLNYFATAMSWHKHKTISMFANKILKVTYPVALSRRMFWNCTVWREKLQTDILQFKKTNFKLLYENHFYERQGLTTSTPVQSLTKKWSVSAWHTTGVSCTSTRTQAVVLSTLAKTYFTKFLYFIWVFLCA